MHQFLPIILIVILAGIAWRFLLVSLAKRYNLTGGWYLLAWVAFAFVAVLVRITVLRQLR